MSIHGLEQGILDRWRIDPDDFDLRQDQFRHQSALHGIGHVYRVMILTLLVGDRSKHEAAGRLAFMAAYIHDMARVDDNVSPRHGPDCAEWILPQYRSLFMRYGASKNDLLWIREALVQHSAGDHMKRDDPGYPVTAVLKDADALDRCRFAGCDVSRLRLPESCELVQYAKEICRATQILPRPEPTLREFLGLLPPNRADSLV